MKKRYLARAQRALCALAVCVFCTGASADTKEGDSDANNTSGFLGLGGAKVIEKATVDRAYIDMRTGPGRAYPIFHVVENDEIVELIKRRTDWVKVKTKRDKTGWAHISQMADTFGEDGKQLAFAGAKQSDYLARRWELGFNGGDFEGASSLGATFGYRFTQNFTAEVKVSQATGRFSDSKLASIALMHQPFPEWRVSPFLILGTGIIDTSPDTTLVQSEDRTDTALLVGGGANVYLSRRFVLRLEYNNHLALTSRDSNEEVNEWKLGFNVFF
jgi:uncharacterized protein YgiM (DUF1202 family)